MEVQQMIYELKIPAECYEYNFAHLYTLKENGIQHESGYWCPYNTYLHYQNPEYASKGRSNEHIIIFRIQNVDGTKFIEVMEKFPVNLVEKVQSKKVVLFKKDFHKAKKIFIEYYRDKIALKQKEIAWIDDQINMMTPLCSEIKDSGKETEK
jgi:hypothetical protein